MSTIRVFLVDDHPVVREGIRRLLELEDNISVVGEANTAEEAIGLVAASDADVVLMDIRLPGIDGIEATRNLKTLDPHLKVVVLSSFGAEYVDQAIAAGANGYILKTATQPELARAVVLAADGLSAIDPRLTPHLFDRFAELSKAARVDEISSRQREILGLIAEGMSSKEIASRLSVGHATVTRELRHIFDRLGVDSRTHAVAEAHRRGLL